MSCNRAADTQNVMQRHLLGLYQSPIIQTATLTVIVASFLTSLVHSQMRPEHGSRMQLSFLRLEEIYAGLFTLEVSLALFALGPNKYFSRKSNIFDVIVVVVCLGALIFEEMPSGVSAFRFLRIARLARIFGMLREVYNLRVLIISLSNATVPVLYSFLLMGVVLSMFAVVATELFSEVDPTNFGDLERSGFTLFQVLTPSLSVVHVVSSLSCPTRLLHAGCLFQMSKASEIKHA
jgi:hypothetical protein